MPETRTRTSESDIIKIVSVILFFKKNILKFFLFQKSRAIVQNYPETLFFGRQRRQRRESGDGDCGTAAAPCSEEPQTSCSTKEASGVKLKRKVSSLFKKKPQRSILKKTGADSAAAAAGEQEKEVANNNNNFEEQQTLLHTTTVAVVGSNGAATEADSTVPTVVAAAQSKHNASGGGGKATMSFHHLRVRRQSLTYRGAMLSISRYRLRASSCPDIYRNSMSTIAMVNKLTLSFKKSLERMFRVMPQEDMEGLESEDASCWQKTCSLARHLASTCCPTWQHSREDDGSDDEVGGSRKRGGLCGFLSAGLVLFFLSNFVLYAWYDVMYVYLVDFAEKDLSLGSTDATLLLSVIGLLNTAGEVMELHFLNVR